MRRKLQWGAAALAMVALTLASCGSSGEKSDDAPETSASSTTQSSSETADSSTEASTTESEAADSDAISVPSAVLERGYINAGGPIQAPPYIYKDDNGDVAGLTIDLIDAVGDALGVDVKWIDTTYDNASPSLISKRIDLFTGSYTDLPERQELVDFVDYYYLDVVLMVKEGNPSGIKNMDDLCGKIAAAARGSSPVATVNKQTEKCRADGREDVILHELPDNAAVHLEVQSGRADAFFETLANGEWMIAEGQPFENITSVSHSYAGAAFEKSNTDMRDAVEAGFRKIMDDGVYAQILQKWHVDALAMPEPIINGSTTKPLTAP